MGLLNFAGRSVLTLAAASLFTASLGAQVVTEEMVALGNFSCQTGPGLAYLDDSTTPAMGTVHFRYDNWRKELWVTVTNTSPVRPGVANPVISDVYFNLPPMAGMRMELIHQDGWEGATPNASEAYSFGPGASILTAGCFGDFDVHLDLGQGALGGITNPNADTFALPKSQLAGGPVLFVFGLGGQRARSLTAADFAFAMSRNSSMAVPAAFGFEGGGVSAMARGEVALSNNCKPVVSLTGQPCIGNTVTLRLDGADDCFGTVLGSFFRGPTQMGGGFVPIGLPATTFFSGWAGSSLTLTIPQDPSLVEQIFYFTGVLTDGFTIEFSRTLDVPICQ